MKAETTYPMTAGDLRKLAVEADCDPRTIKKILQGYPPTTISGRRAFRVLQAAGLVTSAVSR